MEISVVLHTNGSGDVVTTFSVENSKLATELFMSYMAQGKTVSITNNIYRMRNNQHV